MGCLRKERITVGITVGIAVGRCLHESDLNEVNYIRVGWDQALFIGDTILI